MSGDIAFQVDWHRRYVQQARWTRDLRDYLYQKARLADARRALEVGCGTGALLAELPARTPAAVHGLDLSLPNLKQAAVHAPSAALGCGDAHALPYPSHAFDITLCHFLLLWVADPVQALREMARVTRPGGAVLALAEPDYGGRIDYPPELADLGRWQAESLRRQGAAPDLGRKLAGLFAQAGMRLIEAGVLGGRWSDPPTPEERETEWAVIEADLSGAVPEMVIQKLKALDEAAWKCGERVLYIPTFYAWGQTR